MLMLAIDCTNAKLETIIRLLKLLLGIVQLVIPMGLIVLGSLDLAKGVFAQDESVIKKNQMLFVKRLIAAILIFFTSLIVRIVMGLVGMTRGRIAGTTFLVSKTWHADMNFLVQARLQ